jgi:protein-L-isoaspartate O-methyltransferase
MIQVIDSIRDDDETHDEDNRLETQHGRVAFATAMADMACYLKPGARIIAIGAGTGCYSHALTGRGWRVDAVERVARNIAVFKAGPGRTSPSGRATRLT